MASRSSMASIHNSLEFFDGFVLFDGLTGLLDLSFDGLAGLTDLNLIDDLDLIRFLTQFSIFHTASGLDRDTVAVVHVTFGVMRHIVGPH